MKIKHTIASLILLTAGMTASAATVGLNFTSQWPGVHVGAGNTADGFNNWTDSIPEGSGASDQFGTISLLGSSITATWNADGFWHAGAEVNKEQALYRGYLDDGDNGNSLYAGDGIGVSVTITGLGAWLAASGDSSYEIRAYSGTDRDVTWGFQPVSVRLGAPAGSLTSLSILDTISVPVLGNGDYPTGGLGVGDLNTIRGYGDSSALLTADTITLTIPVMDGGNFLRGPLAGFKITTIPVPEPSSMALAVMGGFGVLMMKRRFKKS